MLDILYFFKDAKKHGASKSKNKNAIRINLINNLIN